MHYSAWKPLQSSSHIHILFSKALSILFHYLQSSLQNAFPLFRILFHLHLFVVHVVTRSVFFIFTYLSSSKTIPVHMVRFSTQNVCNCDLSVLKDIVKAVSMHSLNLENY